MTKEKVLFSKRSQSKGFTSIELIIVILVISILTAAVVMKNPFSSRGYSNVASDQLVADIKLVQIRAMSTNRSQNILFNLGTSSYDLREGATVIEQKKLPEDTLIRTASFGANGNALIFNTLGEPVYSGTISLGNAATSYVSITVSPTTGRAIVSAL